MEKAKEIPLQPANRVYRDQLVTLGDLQEFKEDLLLSIKAIIQNNTPLPTKKWLKSYEVKKMLNISGGTFMTLRKTGQLPYKRVGGLMFYDAAEIDLTLTSPKRLPQ